MQSGARERIVDETRAPSVDSAPWAIALNESAATDDVEVTLLTLTVVDDILRVSGLLRVVRRADVRLLSTPALTLATRDGLPLTLVRAHALPDGRLLWVSWTYERPADVRTEYEARIGNMDFALRAGGAAREAMPGPWVFTFRIPALHEADGSGHPGDSLAEA